MPDAPYIPAATVEKLNGAFPKGTRHKAALAIAIPLIGNGLSPTAVYQTLREKFPEDVTDLELENVVRWAADRNPTPSGYGKKDVNGFQPLPPQPRQPKPKPKPPLEVAQWWLSGFELTKEKFVELSPFTVPSSANESCRLMFELLYSESEWVNIVCNYIETPEKANPNGGGKIMPVGDWIRWIKEKGVPSSRAGAWVRPNPCMMCGSGKDDAVTNDDILQHRFLLIESDDLPLEVQLALYAKLKIPIAAVILSGGKSAHAWARLDSPDEESYKITATRILKALEPFGIDQSNKNCSRLSRLPGATRVIGAVNGGLQELLWINPKVTPITEEVIVAFEESLQSPLVEEKPFKRTWLNALPRYEEMIANRGKLGVPTGIADFDRDTGGLKGGQMTIIAAETNGGKSTLAVNIANTAASRGFGVALFTLEMDRDEICDLLVSLNCKVNRNFFNTGDFTQDDIDRMVGQSGRMSELPLWIDDAPTLTAAQIRQRVIQLKTEGRISLVIVDYIQIVTPDDQREPREQQVAGIARALRVMAKEVKLPLIVLSQLNDDGKLRESRVVAHEAHNVILLEAVERNSTVLKMKVCKGRRIPKKTYELYYEPQYCRMTSAAKVSDDDVPGQ